jgi:CubicO group peptidase (beta-lactamase class C family)
MELDTYLAEQHRQGHWSGSAFASRNGRPVLDSAYGLADYASGRQNSPQTAYQIASVSKQFTAAAILLLQEQGRLSVKDHISTWVPGTPPEWEPITVHHLLTHTSGIAHWRDMPELDLYAPTSREHLLHTFFAHPLKFPPGTGWSYSSPGYVLLAHIVEQISGEHYALFVRTRLFLPLGLSESGIGNQTPHPGQQAAGYEHGLPVPSFELDTVGIGTGDVWSTTHDLARWDAAISTPRMLLGEASVEAMFTPHAEVLDDSIGIRNTRYGYGWFLADVSGHSVRFHPGDNSGFCSLNVQLADGGGLLILLSNDQDTDPSALGLPLLGQILAEQ